MALSPHVLDETLNPRAAPVNTKTETTISAAQLLLERGHDVNVAISRFAFWCIWVAVCRKKKGWASRSSCGLLMHSCALPGLAGA